MLPDDSPPGSDDPDGRDEHPAAPDPGEGLAPDDPAEGLIPDDPAEGLRPDPPQTPDPADVDPELRAEFWAQVVLFNVALLGTSLGVMLVGFEGRWLVGGAAFAAGTVAFVRGWLRYRSVRND